MKRKRLLALLLTLVMCLSLVPAGARVFAGEGKTAENDEFIDYLKSQFDDPEIEYRPEVRWWMNAGGYHTDETLDEEVSMMQELGFGGVEFLAMNTSGIDNSRYGWGSDEWIEDSKFIIKEATEKGMGFSVTSGTHWSNANLPDTYEVEPGVNYSPDHPSAGQEISFTQITVAAKATYDDVVPRYTSSIAEVRKYTLQTVVAVGMPTSSTLDPNDIHVIEWDEVDVNDSGVAIDWTAPDTNPNYRIFAVWMHGSAETNVPSVSKNYTVNYTDPDGAQAVMAYWEEFILTPEMRELIAENGKGQLYMDSLELAGHGNARLLWGYSVIEEFEKRNGYSLEPYIPFLFGSGTAGSTGAGSMLGFANFTYLPISNTTGRSGDEKIDKVRNDFYQVMTELYIENMLQPLREWLHTFGMTLRAEVSYGGVFYEISQATKWVDSTETESLEFGTQIESYRNFSGPAHLYGKPLSSETGAIGRGVWNGRMDLYNEMMYRQFASGIGRTVLHVWSSSWSNATTPAWPGFTADTWSEKWDKRQPMSDHFKEWTTMVARNQKALRQGVPRVDIGILRNDYMIDNLIMTNHSATTDFMLTDRTYYFSSLNLQNAGFTYDYFSPLLLGDEDIVFDDGVVQPDGPGYQALILYQEELPLDSAKTLLEWAQGGLPVVFVDGNNEHGRSSLMAGGGPRDVTHSAAAIRSPFTMESDAELAGIVAEIKALENVKVVSGASNAYDALVELGVYPRAAFSESNNKILTYTRKDEANDVLYLYAYNYKPGHNNMLNWNNVGETYTTEISIDEVGKPYAIDAWTGEITPIGTYRIEDGRTIVEVSLNSGATTLIALNLGNEGSLHALQSDAYKTFENNGNFLISAVESGTYTTELSNGKTAVTNVQVPDNINLGPWNLTVETWTAGPLETRMETKSDKNYTTTEYRYATDKTPVDLGTLTQLDTWRNLGVNKSGIGTYITTFELPADWKANNGAILQIGSICRNSAVVFVNGIRVAIPFESLKVDITKYLIPDKINEIAVKVGSTLTMSMGTQTQNYGMIGETKLITYTNVIVDAKTTFKLADPSKTEYEANAPFDVIVTTGADATKVKIVNELGNSIGKLNEVVTRNDDGTKTYRITLMIGTPGELRTLTAMVMGQTGDYQDVGSTLDVTIVKASPVQNTDDIISAAAPGTCGVNTPFTVTVVTSRDITKVKIVGETGASIGTLGSSVVTNGNMKTWTISIKVGSKGNRTLTALGAGSTGGYGTDGKSFNIVIQ